MKKNILIRIASLCLSSSGLFVHAIAQSDGITIKKLRIDSVTAKGKPIGDASSLEIDKGGGRVFSADSKIELIIPPDALTKKRNIKIQAVTNHAANGRGNAYQFEPSGLEFQKPVTLVYRYSQDELSGTSAEFKGMAWQDDKGKWQALPEVTLDTAAKTITTQINHFSSYASFDAIVLKPEHARVKVEKSIQMQIHFAFSTEEIALPPIIPNPQWSVNGINYGNAFVGTCVSSSINMNHAKYTAPASMPDDNPVAVSAQLNGMEFRFNGRTFRNPSLVSHLLIYDKAYRITMSMWVDNSQDGICTMRMADQGSFTLLLEGTRSMLKEITNQNLQVRFNPCPCAPSWTNRPLPGPINTIGAKKIDVTPASLPNNPFRKVKIMLAHDPSPLPLVKHACPARGMPPTMGLVYLPPMIEFEANNESEQRITLSELSRGSMQNKPLHGLIILIKEIEE